MFNAPKKNPSPAKKRITIQNNSKNAPSNTATPKPSESSTDDSNLTIERAASSLSNAAPSVVLFESSVAKFDEVVSSLKHGSDKLLENVEARHCLKTIHSHSTVGGIVLEKLKVSSSLAQLALAIGKCVPFFDVNNLLTDKSEMWWTHEISAVTMTWTSESAQFCKKLAFEADSVLQWFHQILASKSLQNLITDNRTVGYLLEFSLGTLHNIARVSECRSKLSEMKFHDILDFYLTSGPEVTRCLAMIFTASISNEEESARFSDKYGIIPSLVKFLDSALQDADHHCNGFQAEELARGMSLILANDDNKPKFRQAGALTVLEKLLQSDNEGEQMGAIDCFWMMAFDEKERQQILSMDTVLDRLAELSQNKVEDVRIRAKKALNFIKNGKKNLGKSKIEAEVARAPTIGHIFISYSWKQQPICKRIRDLLQQSGHKTWMDIDAMHGSTLEAMAEGIEDSQLVVVCYSDDYKQSPNCRTEAEYLFQLRKPFIPVNLQRGYKPDGWLGMIIGTKLYIDMSLVKSPWEEVAPKLMNELESMLGTPKAANAVEAPIVKNQTQSATQPQAIDVQNFEGVSGASKKALSVAFVKSKLESWKIQEVQQWLERQNLAQCGRIMALVKDMNGRHISVIFEMKLLVPELFYETLLKNLGGSLVDVLKFTDALDHLPDVLVDN